MQHQAAAESVERERDRQIRAQIDPLIGQLSFVGKWELIMRLSLESVRQGFGDAAHTIEGKARTELPRGSSALERDGGGEEALDTNPPPAATVPDN